MNCGFLLVTVFEACSPLALLSATFRRSWLVVMLAFHLSTLVLMNIVFWENMLLLAVVFGPRWPQLTEARDGELPPIS
jgi:hypothetical protein